MALILQYISIAGYNILVVDNGSYITGDIILLWRMNWLCGPLSACIGLTKEVYTAVGLGEYKGLQR